MTSVAAPQGSGARRTYHAFISVVAGLSTGTAAGLVGVGGGEFRIPVLVQLLRFPLKTAAAINLVVGIFTVVVGVLRRWPDHQWNTDDLVLAGVMGAASLVGAVVGCLLRGRLAARPLKWFVSVYLTAVGLWMLYEAVAHVEHVLLAPTGPSRQVLAAAVGLVIAVVSGVLGVAGGEMRIPALLYLFGVPIREAGALSLAISVPTVAAGAVTDRRLGEMPNGVLRVAFLMGVGSVAGVLIGAAFLPYFDRDLLKGVLGAILLLATVRLSTAVDDEGRRTP